MPFAVHSPKRRERIEVEHTTSSSEAGPNRGRFRCSPVDQRHVESRDRVLQKVPAAVLTPSLRCARRTSSPPTSACEDVRWGGGDGVAWSARSTTLEMRRCSPLSRVCTTSELRSPLDYTQAGLDRRQGRSQRERSCFHGRSSRATGRVGHVTMFCPKQGRETSQDDGLRHHCGDDSQNDRTRPCAPASLASSGCGLCSLSFPSSHHVQLAALPSRAAAPC